MGWYSKFIAAALSAVATGLETGVYHTQPWEPIVTTIIGAVVVYLVRNQAAPPPPPK
jgi:hypothetical protein